MTAILVKSDTKKYFGISQNQSTALMYISDMELTSFRDRISATLSDDVAYLEAAINMCIPATHRIITVPIFNGQRPLTRERSIVPLRVTGEVRVFFNNTRITSICELCSRHMVDRICPDYVADNMSCLDAVANGRELPWMDLNTYGEIVYNNEPDTDAAR